MFRQEASLSRAIYRVRRDGVHWYAIKEGEAEAYCRSELKASVVALAREEAQKNAPSRLVIERDDGSVLAEYTYDPDQ